MYPYSIGLAAVTYHSLIVACCCCDWITPSDSRLDRRPDSGSTLADEPELDACQCETMPL
jgi:hypothetical protein